MSGAVRFELVRFPSPEALAQDAARRWMSELAAARAGVPQSVAISGGRIAGTFFKAVVAQAQAKRVDLSITDFFWADERCVPPTDSESNFKLAQELLLTPLAVPPGRIHRVRGEADPQRAAAEAAEDLRRTVPLNTDGARVLDRVFLGMGEDGHTASLFPGQSDQFLSAHEPYAAVYGPKPPPWRVTLTFPVLAAAREAWVLASGAGKEQALRDSLREDAHTPVGRLLTLRQHTLIFTDISV
jgi:6-phosphogluconolactonase